MKTLIHRCVRCGRYTLATDKCPECGGEVRSAHPPQISLEHRHIDLILRARQGLRGET